MRMRPSSIFALIILMLLMVDLLLVAKSLMHDQVGELNEVLTAELGLSDLCLSTEARYTRHLSISDATAPFMDHPAALEHFPSGSFYGKVQ